MSDNVTTLIGKAIREGKYLDITYKNQDENVKPFWISVLDINPHDELRVNMFNVTKDEPILDAKIFISSILTAEILKFSHYDVPEGLIKKIEEDKNLEVYDFDRFDNSLLNYYLDCYKANQDPLLHKQHLIPSIDLNELTLRNPYPLTHEQQKTIIKEIYHNDYNKFYNYELALCEFSIDIASRGKFVVAFRKLTFDPVGKTLQISSKPIFNPHFYIDSIRYSLSYYADLSPSDFEEIYLRNQLEAIKLFEDSYRPGETTNTRPEIVVLKYEQISISAIYDEIHAEYEKKSLEVPLRTFFRSPSLHDRTNRKEPHIVLYDNNINIDQLRTIYNSLKFPITYVQGPPGTGKTHTILNIVVNCLTNNKTMLITSNNNTPIDGIKDKLVLGTYKNKEILFPIIRLGNNQLTIKALKRMKALRDFDTKDTPKEKLLSNLKERSKENTRILSEKLKNYEDRLDLLQNIEFIDKLMSSGVRYYLLEKQKKNLEDKLSNTPETTQENINGLNETIKDNPQLLQYFYFESLKHTKRLKTANYSELNEILDLENEEDQVKKFNAWIKSDENLKQFTKVFPIILTTNLSSRKLGKKFKFDLLTIDEAGQCDIATSLIPISKCQNMVLIGDTNQLKPIVVFEKSRNERLMKTYGIDEDYNYFNNSILSIYKRIDNISRNILLSYHYRCGKKIIEYSNMRFYEKKLNLSEVKRIGNLELLFVNNVNSSKKNCHIQEAEQIVTYIKDHKLTDVFIITPFRNQEEAINICLNLAKQIGEIDHSVSCGTIHKVQGQENKTIIISTAISRETSPYTYDWIKNNSELINVGVTRAKENLIVVTDEKAIDILSRKDDDLYALIDYMKHHGTTQVAQSTVNKFTIGFSNDSHYENEFYKTMSHYCSTKGSTFKRNVKVTDVFPEELHNNKVNKKEFDGVLYEGKIPKIVFELNGGEHYTNKKTIKSDNIKMELLKSKKFKYFPIPNHYAKHYEFIQDLINSFNIDGFQSTLFEDYDNKNEHQMK